MSLAGEDGEGKTSAVLSGSVSVGLKKVRPRSGDDPTSTSEVSDDCGRTRVGIGSPASSLRGWRICPCWISCSYLEAASESVSCKLLESFEGSRLVFACPDMTEL